MQRKAQNEMFPKHVSFPAGKTVLNCFNSRTSLFQTWAGWMDEYDKQFIALV